MDAARLKRLLFAALVTAGVAMGVTALVLLARWAPDLTEFGRRHVLILAVNVAAAIALLVLIGANFVRLLRDYRNRLPGARLRARMVGLFAGLSVAPLLVVYVFALLFLQGGIDNWFKSDLEQDLSAALRLSREVLQVQARMRLDQTRSLSTAIADLDGPALARALPVLRTDAGADELDVFDGKRLRLLSGGRADGLSSRLPEEAIDGVKLNGRYVALEPEGPSGYQIRAVVRLPVDERGVRYFQAVYAVGERQGRLADAVEDTFSRYAELRYLRDPLKSSLMATLSLVLLLSVLAAIGGAFFFARRLTAPVESLIAGTEAVARGEFDTRLPVTSRDEIGFLVESFNGMIGRLAKAREEGRVSRLEVERERANLAVILARLSTGVIAVDTDGRVRIANDAAGEILGVDVAAVVGSPLGDLGAGQPLARQFIEACGPHLAAAEPEWRGQVELRTDGGRRLLNCASNTVPGDDRVPGGTILVFDDVTTLLDAQREAAWGEVARRLAHEIKNPLTPIRLAAERIRRRYLATMSGEDAQVLDRSTHTIVQQVEAMRDMVNAFSEYARVPALSPARFDLNQLVREVAWLYRAQEGQPALRLSLDDKVGEVEADAGRVRQLLHNLIRNAQDAVEGQPDGAADISTRLVVDGERVLAEIAVSDNGPGIAESALPRLFEPYVTTKHKGTGLGLAIVRKLVEEHGGSVTAENLPERGARLTVRLPIRAQAAEAGGDGRGTLLELRRERA